MPDRPYSDHTIDQLEKLVRANRDKVAVLGPIRLELEWRKTARAEQLLREVRALVEGAIPTPKAPEAAPGEHQGSLFQPDRSPDEE